MKNLPSQPRTLDAHTKTDQTNDKIAPAWRHLPSGVAEGVVHGGKERKESRKENQSAGSGGLCAQSGCCAFLVGLLMDVDLCRNRVDAGRGVKRYPLQRTNVASRASSLVAFAGSWIPVGQDARFE